MVHSSGECTSFAFIYLFFVFGGRKMRAIFVGWRLSRFFALQIKSSRWVKFGLDGDSDGNLSRWTSANSTFSFRWSVALDERRGYRLNRNRSFRCTRGLAATPASRLSDAKSRRGAADELSKLEPKLIWRLLQTVCHTRHHKKKKMLKMARVNHWFTFSGTKQSSERTAHKVMPINCQRPTSKQLVYLTSIFFFFFLKKALNHRGNTLWTFLKAQRTHVEMFESKDFTSKTI